MLLTGHMGEAKNIFAMGASHDTNFHTCVGDVLNTMTERKKSLSNYILWAGVSGIKHGLPYFKANHM